MPEYYTEILIIGPHLPINPKILELYKNPPRLIVGDGVNPISKKDLQSIKKLIGPETRIDIFGHGKVVSEREHNIKLLQKKASSTKEALAIIGSLTEYAQHIHLWSCYSGAANDAALTLPEGSMFITHAPENDFILLASTNDSLIRSIQEREARRKANINYHL